MPITVRDVAARAGVSPVVVSRVLHNKALSIRVSEATAERVRKAAADLGYRLNVFARNFREQQTMTIGLLHGTGVTRPQLDEGSRYFASLLDGIIEGAFKRGYSLTLCPKLLGASPEDALSDGRFDGLVWYSSVSTDENLETVARSSVPVAIIHAHADRFDNRHPAVLCDNDQGVGLAVDHLIELGHRRIAFALDDSPSNLESIERLDAHRRHVQRRGLEFGEDDIVRVGWHRVEVSEYLRQPLRHTAIIAHNDGLAAEFLSQATVHGVRVPEDLSVIGFDSTDYCLELRPTLTSIYQPLKAMGEKAIDLLVKAIKGELTDEKEVIFPCRLDIRASTSLPTKVKS